jgi:hypothetical protein
MRLREVGEVDYTATRVLTSPQTHHTLGKKGSKQVPACGLDADPISERPQTQPRGRQKRPRKPAEPEGPDEDVGFLLGQKEEHDLRWSSPAPDR